MTGRLNSLDSSGKKIPRSLTYGILIFACYFGISSSFAQLETQNKESAVPFVNVISYWQSQDTLNTATFKICKNLLKNSVNNYYLLKETTSSPYAQMRGSHFYAQKLLQQKKCWRQRTGPVWTHNTPGSGCEPSASRTRPPGSQCECLVLGCPLAC